MEVLFWCCVGVAAAAWVYIVVTSVNGCFDNLVELEKLSKDD